MIEAVRHRVYEFFKLSGELYFMKRKFSGFHLFMISIVILAFICGLAAKSPGLVINEFLASNDAVISDEDGDFSDWVEIYNADTEAVNLAGYALSDDPDQPLRWLFPYLILQPGDHLLVWASGKDRHVSDALHTSFKLDADGEYIGIFDPFGNLLDGLSFDPQQTDVSYGRYPDGAESWYFFTNPSPGVTNPEPDDTARVASPVITPPGGFFSSDVSVQITCPTPDAVIYYTLDDSDPDETSTMYTSPVALDVDPTTATMSVIRARAFKSGLNSSRIKSASFLFNSPHTLPVFSFVTDPDNLWDPDIGIIPNAEQSGRDWERPLSIQMFEPDGDEMFSLDTGVRLHGTYSRTLDKKSFRVYCRQEYGQDRLEYPLFPDIDVDSFKRFIIRNGGDPFSTCMRDTVLESHWRQYGGLTSANRYVVLYINGEYWGLYNLRERIDEYYVQDHFGIDDNDVNLMKADYWVWENESGKPQDWFDVYHYVEHNDLTSDTVYQEAVSHFDMDNFIDHCIWRIWGADVDWPHNNIYTFNSEITNGPWRQIMWDADWSFGGLPQIHIEHNTLAWALRSEPRPDLFNLDMEHLLWGTVLFRQFASNEKFRRRFISRYADLLNTAFAPRNVFPVINSNADLIRPEMARNYAKWGDGAGNVNMWEESVDYLRIFSWTRNQHCFRHVVEEFDMPGTGTLTIWPRLAGGKVRVNSVIPKHLPFGGVYFIGIPLELEALPEPGYHFGGWYGDITSKEPEIYIELPEGNITVYPKFLLDKVPASAFQLY